MAWLDSIFSRDRRLVLQARASFDEGRFDDALELLREVDPELSSALLLEIRKAAALHYLREAVAACERGEGDRMRQRLARARRYHTDALDPLFRAADRRIREQQLRLTTPEHWLVLLNEARAQEELARLDPEAVGRWGLFRSSRAPALAAAAWQVDTIDVERVERADRPELRKLLEPIRGHYPDDLAEAVPRLGHEFVRAVLLVSLGRPDLAVVPLLELPESDPLVSFERARVAYVLGRPRLALTALQSFATLVGGHRTIRRLNTGVFLAQMAIAVGESRRALLVLDELPVRYLGRRPVALYARLLVEAGRLRDARELLVDHLGRHPDHADAVALFEEVRTLLDHGALDAPSGLTVEVLATDDRMLLEPGPDDAL